MRHAAIGILILLTQACQNPFSPERDITLGVSEVVVPESASPNGRFTITLTVVTGGCKRFERFRANRSPAILTLEARGTDSPGRLCTHDVRFEPHSFEVEGPFANPFTVSVVQPDGSFISRTIRIE